MLTINKRKNLVHSDLSRLSLNAHTNFPENFLKCFSTGHFSTIVQFLEDFSQTCPLSLDYILQAYLQFTNKGMPTLADECARIYAATCFKSRQVAELEFGLSPVYNFICTSQNHGSLVDQFSFTKMMVDSGELKKKPVFPVDKITLTETQAAFLPYMYEAFDLLLEDATDIKLLENLRPLSPYAPVFYNYSQTKYGHNRRFFYDCYPDLVSKGISLKPLILKDKTFEIALNFLKPYHYNLDSDFVVLYLDEGLPKTHLTSTVQLKTHDYNDVVDQFINQGLKVIRIGTEDMTPMHERSGFLDLTNIHRPKEVDIFLCAQARLYFGSGTGPCNLAYTFGVPVAETARLEYAGVRPKSFVQYLHFHRNTSDASITFSEIRDLGLNTSISLTAFQNRGLSPEIPTSQDNLQFGIEAIEYFEKGAIYAENMSYKDKMANFYIWGGLSSKSLNLLGRI